MRRRHCDRSEAARSFYKQHDGSAAGPESVITGGEQQQQFVVSNESKSRKGRDDKLHSFAAATENDDNQKGHKRSMVGVLIQWIRCVVYVCRSAMEGIALLASGTLRRLRTFVVGDVDRLDHCVSCARHFSSLRSSSKRTRCANCQNDFCASCLNKRHQLFDDGTRNGGPKKAVCSYCFFTLCARHCRAACCMTIPTKELVAFVQRKGINSKLALEKTDLVALIHDWSLELDQKARLSAEMDRQDDDDDGFSNNNSADIEAGSNNNNTVKSSNNRTAYCASSAHLLVNSMEAQNSSVYYDYSRLSILELRNLLHKQHIDTSACVEKSDLIHLLVGNTIK